MKSKIKKVLYYLLLSLSLIFFTFAVIFAVRSAGEEDVFFFNYRPYVIVSESMEPTIKKYGFILVKKADFSSIKEGEIISFKYDKVHVCHRVKSVTEKGLVTKGDNSRATDNFLTTPQNFNGRVIFHSNILADYINFYKSRGPIIAVVLPVLAIVVIIISIRILRRRIGDKSARKKSKNTSDSDSDKKNS